MNVIEQIEVQQKTRRHIAPLNNEQLMKQINESAIVFHESSKEMIRRLKRIIQNANA